MTPPDYSTAVELLDITNPTRSFIQGRSTQKDAQRIIIYLHPLYAEMMYVYVSGSSCLGVMLTILEPHSRSRYTREVESDNNTETLRR